MQGVLLAAIEPVPVAVGVTAQVRLSHSGSLALHRGGEADGFVEPGRPFEELVVVGGALARIVHGQNEIPPTIRPIRGSGEAFGVGVGLGHQLTVGCGRGQDVGEPPVGGEGLAFLDAQCGEHRE